MPPARIESGQPIWRTSDTATRRSRCLWRAILARRFASLPPYRNGVAPPPRGVPVAAGPCGPNPGVASRIPGLTTWPAGPTHAERSAFGAVPSGHLMHVLWSSSAMLPRAHVIHAERILLLMGGPVHVTGVPH